MHSIKIRSADLPIAGDRCHFEVTKTHKIFAVGIYLDIAMIKKILFGMILISNFRICMLSKSIFLFLEHFQWNIIIVPFMINFDRLPSSKYIALLNIRPDNFILSEKYIFLCTFFMSSYTFLSLSIFLWKVFLVSY